MKKQSFVFKFESNVLLKVALMLFSLSAALLFGSDKKKDKKHGIIAKTKRNYNTADAVANAFYLHSLKKEAEKFPVKLETAEIIDI